MTKPCVKCGATDRNKRGNCRPCRAAYNKAHQDKQAIAAAEWRAANLERAKASHAKWKAENPEKVKISSAKYRATHRKKVSDDYTKWRADNPEKHKATRGRWLASHPENDRVAKHKRRARKREVGGSFTSRDVENILKLQKNKCVVCLVDISKNFHIDHIMPLALGGSNGVLNIQLLCPSCNLSKHHKHPVDFMRERGFLL